MQVDLVEVERCIIKKYRKKLWSPFVKALQDFNLVEENDKIGVAISGGKDSLLMAKLMQEIQKHGNKKIELVFIAMDPGFDTKNYDNMIQNCKDLGIPLEVFRTNVFEVSKMLGGESPCYLCARMRRGALYSKAQELGCNKLALGHHYDDVIETTMLNVLYSGNFKTMLPKLKAQNFENMELIRPMYYIRERDIIAFRNHCGIEAMNCGCDVAAGKNESKRAEIKRFIADYKNIFEDVDKSIFNAGMNVNLDAIGGWQKDGIKHSYLEYYDNNISNNNIVIDNNTDSDK